MNSFTSNKTSYKTEMTNAIKNYLRKYKLSQKVLSLPEEVWTLYPQTFRRIGYALSKIVENSLSGGYVYLMVRPQMILPELEVIPTKEEVSETSLDEEDTTPSFDEVDDPTPANEKRCSQDPTWEQCENILSWMTCPWYEVTKTRKPRLIPYDRSLWPKHIGDHIDMDCLICPKLIRLNPYVQAQSPLVRGCRGWHDLSHADRYADPESPIDINHSWTCNMQAPATCKCLNVPPDQTLANMFNRYIQKNKQTPSVIYYKYHHEELWRCNISIDSCIFMSHPVKTKKEAYKNALKDWYSFSARNILVAHKQRSSDFAIPESDFDAQGPIETENVETSSKVTLVSQRDVSEGLAIPAPIPLPDDLTTFGDKYSEFSDLCNRLNNLLTFQWTTDQTRGSIIRTIDLPIDLLSVLKNNPTYLPFLQYAFVRPELTMHFQPNSTRFHQGALICAVRYYSSTDLDSEGPRVPKHANELVPLDHVILNASVSNTGILEIPFVSFLDQLSTQTDTASRLYYATIYIGVLTQLRTVDANSNNVNVATFFQFSCKGRQTRFYGQRSRRELALPEMPSSRDLSSASRNIGQLSSNPVLSWIPGASQVLGLTSTLTSSFSRMIGAVEDLASGPGAKLRPRNCDKPDDPRDPQPLMIWANPQLSSGNGVNHSRVLRLTPSDVTPHHPSSVPSDGSEFTASHFKKVWGVTNVVTMTSADTVNSIIASGVISPVAYDSSSITTAKGALMTPTGFLANFFQCYSGDIEIKFLVLKTAMQTFRLRLTHSPDVPITSSNVNDLPSVIFDFQESEEFSSVLPYYAPTRIASMWNGTNVTYPYPVCYGNWALSVETPMCLMDAVSSDIDIVVFQRAADNLMMTIPRPNASLVAVEPTTANTVNYTLSYVASTTTTSWNTINVWTGSNRSPYVGTSGVSQQVAVVKRNTVIVGGTARPNVPPLGPEDISIYNNFGSIRVLYKENGVLVSTIKPGETLDRTLQANVAVSLELNDVFTAIPESGEEKLEETNMHDPMVNRTVASGAIHVGELFDLKALCRRYNLAAVTTLAIPASQYGLLEWDVTASTLTADREEGARLSLMQSLHDCYRFYRGGMNYQIVLRTDSRVLTRVIHDPHPVDVLTGARFTAIDTYPRDYLGLANEMMDSNLQSVIPITIPYYSRANVLVNGYDASSSPVIGRNAFANGRVSVLVQPYSGAANVTIEVWQAMADDGSFYTFQGIPRTLVQQTYVDGNAIPESGEEEDLRVDPVPKESTDGVQASPTQQDFDIYSALQQLVRDRSYSKKVRRNAARALKVMRRKRAHAESPLDEYVGKCVTATINSKVASGVAGAVVGLATGNPVAGMMTYKANEINTAVNDAVKSASNLESITSTMRSAADTLTTSVCETATIVQENLANLPSLLGGMLSDVSTAATSAVQTVADAASVGTTNLMSALAHMFSMIYSSEIGVKVASVVGILTCLGILTANLFGKAFELLTRLWSSTKRYLFGEEPYAVPEAPEPIDDKDPLLGWSKLIISSLCSILGFVSGSSKSFWEGSLRFFKEGLWAVNSIDTFLRNNLEAARDWIYWMTGQENPMIATIKTVKENGVELETWARQVLYATSAENTDRILNSVVLQQEVEKLYEKSCEYVIKMKNVDPALRVVLSKLHTKIASLHDKYAQTVSAGTPKEPICLWFSGVPGVGKSSAISRVCTDLAVRLGIVCDGNAFFSVTSGTKFWNDFHGQPIIVYDDWGAVKEPATYSKEISDFIRLCSCTVFNPEQAELEDKKRIANPDILAVTSNQIWPESNLMNDKMAVWRRRDLLVYVVLAPWVLEEFPGLMNLNDKRITKERKEQEDFVNFKHLLFHVLDPIKVTPSTGLKIDDALTLDQLRDTHFPRLCDLAQARKARAIREKKDGSSLTSAAWTNRLGVNVVEESLAKEVQAQLLKASLPLGERLRQSAVEMGLLTESKPQEIVLSPATLAGPESDDAEAKPVLPAVGVTRKADEVCLNGCNFSQVDLRLDPQFQNTCLHSFGESKADFTKFVEEWGWCEVHEGWYNENKDIFLNVLACPATHKDVGVHCSVATRNEFDKVWAAYATERMARLLRLGLSISDIQLVYPEGRKPNYEFRPLELAALNVVEEKVTWYKSLSDNIWDYIKTAGKIVLGAICAYLVYHQMSGLVKDVGMWWNADTSSELGYAVHSAAKTEMKNKLDNTAQLGTCAWKLAFGEIASSGDVKTAVSKRANTILGKLAKPQSPSDVMSALRRNTCWVSLGQEGRIKLVRCLGLVDRHVLMPYHYIAEYPKMDLCRILINGPTDMGGAIGIDPSSLVVRRVDQADLCVVEFPNRIPSFRNILGLLPSDTEIAHLGTNSTLVETSTGSDIPVLHELGRVRPVKRMQVYELHGEEYVNALMGYEYDYHKKGLCGSLLFDNKMNKIFGIHVSTQQGKGYSQVVARSMFDELDVRVKDKIEPELKSSVKAVMQPRGDYIPIGTLERETTPNLPTKTAIVESPCFEVLAPPARRPVELKTKGEARQGYAAMQNAVEKQTNPTSPWPHLWVSEAVEDLKQVLLARAKPITHAKSRRAFQEAIAGVPGVAFMDGLYLMTSPGYPLSVEYPSQKKTYFLQLEEENGLRRVVGLHPRLAEIYSANHQARLDGILPFSPYLDFLKDERLKEGKAPRLINGAPMDEVIEWRRYTLDFMAAFQHARFEVGCAIGMNVRSAEWTDMANHLLALSPHILTGDYKGFGPGLDAQLVNACGEIARAWYSEYCPEKDAEDDRIRTMLFEGLAQCQHVAGDLVYQTVCGSPSGNPFTAPINSLVNLLYLRLVWLAIFEGNPALCNMQAFNKYHRYVVYGDDYIGSIHPDLKHLFNNTTMQAAFAKYGIIFTDAAKDGSVRDYCSIYESQFLKHYFINHPTRTGMFLAALEKSVIEDIPNWIRMPCPDPEQQALDNCDQAIRMAYAWGQDYYQSILVKLQAYWRRFDQPFNPPTWYQIDSQCFDIEKNSLQQSEDLLFLASLLGCANNEAFPYPNSTPADLKQLTGPRSAAGAKGFKDMGELFTFA